jgi:transposase-like protein
VGGRSSFRNVVLTLVERGGSARSFHIDGATTASLLPIIRVNVNRESTLMTDEWTAYKKIGKGNTTETPTSTACRSQSLDKALQPAKIWHMGQ